LSDSPTGHDRAPDRYSGHGRETIDRMRDLAHEMFHHKLADDMFAFHCIATALKYADRRGKKDATEIEEKKLAWYLAMAEHVIDGTPDPRSERADFVPWEHEIITPDGIPATVLRVARRLLGISADAADGEPDGSAR